jgi:hypothetical protein
VSKLSNDEIVLLMEALDALQGKAITDGLFSSLLVSAFTDDKEKAKNEMDSMMSKAQAESEIVKEKVILLKAKLIGMKDRNTIDEASEFLKRG